MTHALIQYPAGPEMLHHEFDRQGGRARAQRHTHLTSTWRSHCTVEKHRAKVNTVSRDKSFSLRLEKHRTGIDQWHPGLGNTLFVVGA